MLRRLGILGVVLVAPCSALAQQTQRAEPNIAIPDEGGNPPAISTVTFTQPGTVGSLRVGVRIDHTYQSDLIGILLPPGVTWQGSSYTLSDIGAQVANGAIVLFESVGGSDDNLGSGASPNYQFLNLTAPNDPAFDPGGTATDIQLVTSTPNLSGTYQPADVAAFQGLYLQDPSNLNGQGGTWTLVVIDIAGQDLGTLIAWEMEYGTAQNAYYLAAGSNQPQQLLQGSDRALAQFHVLSPQAATLSGLTLTYNGSASGIDLTSVRLYNDAGSTPGDLDASDTLVASGSAFPAGAIGTLAFSFAPLSIIQPGFDLLVVADVAIAGGNTVAISVASDADVVSSVGPGFAFPVTGPTLTVVTPAAPALITPGSSFTQDFEAGTFLNYDLVDTAPFPVAVDATSMTLSGSSAITDGARVGIYDANLPTGDVFAPQSGSAQVGLDYPTNNLVLVGAVDLRYDMSALHPSVDTVTLQFSWADLGSEDDAEDIVVLSRDGGATWEVILFNLPDIRPSSYNTEVINLSAFVAGLPGGNFTNNMVIRIQESDDFDFGSDGTLIDDVVVSAGSGPYDAGVSDAGSSDGGWPDATVPDIGWPDATMQDIGWPDATMQDIGWPDATVHDSGVIVPDTGWPDGGLPDAMEVDGGWPDGTMPDLGSGDASSFDAIVQPDGGSLDAQPGLDATPGIDATAQDARTSSGGGSRRERSSGCGCNATSPTGDWLGLSVFLLLFAWRRAG